MSEVSKQYAEALSLLESLEVENKSDIANAIAAIKAMVASAHAARDRAKATAADATARLEGVLKGIGVAGDDPTTAGQQAIAKVAELQERLTQAEAKASELQSRSEAIAKRSRIAEACQLAGIPLAGQRTILHLIESKILPESLAIEARKDSDGLSVLAIDGDQQTPLADYLRARELDNFLPAIFPAEAPKTVLPSGGVAAEKPPPTGQQAVDRVLAPYGQHLAALKRQGQS